MKSKLKILLLIDCNFEAKRGYDFKEELKHDDWSAEKTILKTLKDLGHNVSILGLYNKIEPLLEEVVENKPDVIFNQADVFKGETHFDKNIASILELFEIPYTGASPANLMICNNKALSKKILSYHRIKVPQFYTFYKNRKFKHIKKLKLPCVVKPLSEEASRGISQASVVDNETALIERVKFIHENLGHDAIAEEYIDGREFYVSIIGNKRIQALPLREMYFGDMPEDEPRIATYKAKWDEKYRKKWKLLNRSVTNLSPELTKKAQDVCKRAYKALNMRCYARMDIRITPDDIIYIIEPNANPNLQPLDEFARAAGKANITYDKLVNKLLKLAFQRND
ncbi:ATP-grasp domain-containing protein [bacterium]|nr:ATP-grasp domain-containing protein [bacterium]MBU1918818.1 ATP-grasp domain-containing protein [bacterium]